MADLTAREERWPIAGAFVLSRGAKTEARVVVAELRHGGHVGRGEAVPYARYGESVQGVLAEIEDARGLVEAGGDRPALQRRLGPGAARNALDCALWDIEAKQTGTPVWRRAALDAPRTVETAFTISFAGAEAMGRAAAAAAWRPLLKLKIGGPDDLDRVRAVRAGAPRSRLIVDANEGLAFEDLRRLAPDFAALGVALIEQPLPSHDDAALEGWAGPVPLCADESLHTRTELDACARRYACVNVKLDKAGGLTEALALVAEARARGLQVMAGCMVATSLAMAPALLVAQDAEFVDLDGPLLLARDREPGLRYEGSTIHPADPALWG